MDKTVRTFKVVISALERCISECPQDVSLYVTLAHYQNLVIAALEERLNELEQGYENDQTSSK